MTIWPPSKIGIGSKLTNPIPVEMIATNDNKAKSPELIESETGSFTINASVPGGDLITYQWQVQTVEGGTFFDVPEEAPYSGTQTTTLVITQPDDEFSGYRYRVVLTIPSYVCETVAVELEGSLIVYPDNDKDGVRDLDDDDDDNDGILDIFEGDDDDDNDNDGKANKFDPDSDDDGCPDVIEAGFLDQNNDYKVGPLDSLHVGVFIDNNENNPSINPDNGRVTGHTYLTPLDEDGNGIKDFLEEGAPITDITCPESVTVNEGSDAFFTTDVTVAAGNEQYQWEISNDEGDTWSQIIDPGIMFIGLGEGYIKNNNWTGHKFIELYVTQDIDDLSKIYIYNYKNGSSSPSYELKLSGEADKGDIIIIYQNTNYFNTYFDIDYSSYDKAFPWNYLYTNLDDGDDAFQIMYGDNNADKTLVDVIGEVGVDGAGRPWEYKDGWIKRKNNTYPGPKN